MPAANVRTRLEASGADRLAVTIEVSRRSAQTIEIRRRRAHLDCAADWSAASSP